MIIMNSEIEKKKIVQVRLSDTIHVIRLYYFLSGNHGKIVGHKMIFFRSMGMILNSNLSLHEFTKQCSLKETQFVYSDHNFSNLLHTWYNNFVN